jgi:cytoskeletal protein RodZ
VTTTPKSLLRRLCGARGGALLSSGARSTGRLLVLVGMLGAVLWCGALARADTAPSPTTPTTTTDAPPPDPYQPPAQTAKPKPATQHRAPVIRSAPVAPVRTYSAPAVVRTQTPVRTSRPSVKRHAKSHAKAKPVRKHRKRVVHVKEKPISLAPLAELAASIRAPLPIQVQDDPPFRLLAGISLAVLAVGGCALLLLTLRIARTGAELR